MLERLRWETEISYPLFLKPFWSSRPWERFAGCHEKYLENVTLWNIFRRRNNKMKRVPRILIGKVGLDGHDVGARVVARALADSGMEVVYTGLRQTPEQIVKAAVEEGVDMIGISILSGSHMTFLPEIIRLLDRHNAREIKCIAGGIIPAEDIVALKELGVDEIFPPETHLPDIVNFVKRSIETDEHHPN